MNYFRNVKHMSIQCNSNGECNMTLQFNIVEKSIPAPIKDDSNCCTLNIDDMKESDTIESINKFNGIGDFEQTSKRTY